MQVEFDEARVKAEESFGAVGPLTMIKMQRLLIEFEPKLWEKFQELDTEGTTKLPRKQVIEILSEVCGKLDWLTAMKYWKASDKYGGKVWQKLYLHTIKLLSIMSHSECESQICQITYLMLFRSFAEILFA